MSTPSAANTSRRSVARWTVAAIATGALVVSGSGLVAFAQSGAGESQGPAFVPADAAAYVEARLDMPGVWGVAVHQSIVTASLRAVVNALNRALLLRTAQEAAARAFEGV